MKTNSIIKSVLFVAGFSAFTLAGSAQAQVINVDLNTSSSPTYSGQGAYSDPSHNVWNGLTVATSSSTQSWSSLETSTGTGTSVALALTPTGSGTLIPYLAAGTALVAPDLIDDFAYNNSHNSSNTDFTFSNLNAGDTYNLYIYAQNGAADNAISVFNVGGNITSAINAIQRDPSGSPDSSFVLGNNYVEYTGLTGSTSISGFEVGNESTQNDQINGFQLVDTTVAAPEPSTYALMGLGALALVVISRRRKA